MLPSTPTITQLSEVISHVTAPAFLLAAEAELLAVLVARMDRAVDRSRIVAGIRDDDEGVGLKRELPALGRRARFLHRAIYWTVASGIVTSLLVIMAFITALFYARHEYGAALMFIIALALLTGALISFALEVKLAVSEIERLG